jgi:WhiB family redox-sensing transcriptional regulator
MEIEYPCTEDPELFFAESPQDVESAKALCRGCRARIGCLARALTHQEPWGVWGGELLENGSVVPRKRPRGRPRKVPDMETTSADLGWPLVWPGGPAPILLATTTRQRE